MRKQVTVPLEEGSRPLHELMFLAAFFAFVIEFPLLGTIRDFRLVLPVDRNTRRGKNPAIIIAAGLRTIFINGSFVVDQHGAVSLVVITHEDMTAWQAGRGKKQPARNPLDGSRFFRLDVDEH